MELTYQELFEANRAIPDLLRVYMRGSFFEEARQVARLAQALRIELTVFEMLRTEVQAKHATQDKDGNLAVRPNTEAQVRFQRDMIAVSRQTVDLAIEPLEVPEPILAALDPEAYLLLAPLLAGG